MNNTCNNVANTQEELFKLYFLVINHNPTIWIHDQCSCKIYFKSSEIRLIHVNVTTQ